MSSILYRSPVEVLGREIDHLKKRLKAEKAELAELEGRLETVRDEGLAKLVAMVERDVAATADLVASYRRAIRTLEKA